MKMKANFFYVMMIAVVSSLLLSSCVTIRQGEVGVKRTFGKYADQPFTEGLRMYNPFTTRV
ncbi:MAG: prohibitin family protein, partial [Bacteroidota bacterium]